MLVDKQTRESAPVATQTGGLSYQTPAGETVCELNRHMMREADTDKANHMEGNSMLGSGRDKGNSYFSACFAFISCSVLIVIQDKMIKVEAVNV